MKLDLSKDEAAELEHALKSYLGDLSYEISNTDNSVFKEGLRSRRDLLAGLLERLGADASTDAR